MIPVCTESRDTVNEPALPAFRAADVAARTNASLDTAVSSPMPICTASINSASGISNWSAATRNRSLSRISFIPCVHVVPAPACSFLWRVPRLW